MHSGELIKYEGVNIYQEQNLILGNINVAVSRGEFVYIIGKVGSGKTTFLRTLYAELPVKNGNAKVLNYNLRDIHHKEVAQLRRRIGIIFQDFQVLTDRTVFKNLEFVLQVTGWKNRKDIENRVNTVLEQVGMAHKSGEMPYRLSGGEQQRMAIARALLNSPEILLADEPTRNLDYENGKDIMELLQAIRNMDTTVLMVTHDLNWTKQYPARVLRCEDRQLLEIN
ncbi:MAG: ATP-binding cassette domain-containing protein [Prevotellaceae bacterium]|jgi:cell division transport system ATP-binding protein|nr:ATP-binding cassette domain-containing protein [Prevotellaceae bacterium]